MAVLNQFPFLSHHTSSIIYIYLSSHYTIHAKSHEIPIESQATAFSPGGWLEAARTVVGKLPAYHGRVPQGPPRGVVETPRGQNGWILLGFLGISLVILEKKHETPVLWGWWNLE